MMLPLHLTATSSTNTSSPIPEEPSQTREVPLSSLPHPLSVSSPQTNPSSLEDASSMDSDASTPRTEYESSDDMDDSTDNKKSWRGRRASTILVSQDSEDARKFLNLTGPATIGCCGGGCCKFQDLQFATSAKTPTPLKAPANDAYKAINVKIGRLSLDSDLTDIIDLPEKTVSFHKITQPSSDKSTSPSPQSSLTNPDTKIHPPTFVQPHPPYDVYSAPLWHAKELTKPGAEKRTFHFDLDVSDYPTEGGDVDFVVGGAIGVCAPNHPEVVEKVFDALAVPRYLRDQPVLMKTTKGRWPTIWGEDQAREIVTTRRDLLTWCADLQSYAPTKQIFRLLAEHADDTHERKILNYLSSAQGQGAICDIRTGPYVTVLQLLLAFPSARPPLDHLLSILQQLMPRFYSLSQDPQISMWRDGSYCRKLVEVAVTVHESVDFTGTKRTGVGSGFLERMAKQVIEAEQAGIDPASLNLRIPIFRGLMANPLAREFVADGPMLLIGAGVGIAPFRGFVHRRLKSANCANKVWVIQGVRDSLVDELYSGDWGVHEKKVKNVVQSRNSGRSRYVQDEVKHQADLVWFVINALDGRVFVCGSSKGMGEGVYKALVEVAMEKGGLNDEAAKAFWEEKQKAGQYIAETW